MPRLLATLLLLQACSDDPVAPAHPVPTRLELSDESVLLVAIEDTARIGAVVLDQRSEPMDDIPVVWTSADPEVATVSQDGHVRAVAVGATVMYAEAADLRAEASVEVRQVPAHLRFDPDVVVLDAAGDTLRVTATVRDANDFRIPGGSIAWSSDDDEVATVDADGRVTAVGEGWTRLVGASGGAATGLSVFVGERRLILSSIEPAVLVEGDVATLRGVGFSQDRRNVEVLLDGTEAEIVFAGSTELRIRVPDADCRPARTGTVQVRAFALADSTETAVRPATLDALEVGDGVWTSAQCIHLAGGLGSERYLVGIMSGSGVSSSLTPARLRARTADPALVATLPPVSGAGALGRAIPFAVPSIETVLAERGRGPAAARSAGRIGPDAFRARFERRAAERRAEDRVRDADLRLLARFGPPATTAADRRSAGDASAAPSGAAPLAAVPAVGELRTLNVPSFEGDACRDFGQVRAVARHVGTAAVFFEDEDNPPGGFTATQYDSLDMVLARHTMPVVERYFGELGDLDDNGGRVVVLVTREVNRQENLRGFVFSGDLRTTAQCPGSNQAEIFYGYAPDPEGVHGEARPTEEVLQGYPALIGHEVTHIAQFANARGPRTRWELEGGATLAEQLVGFDVYGHGPRQNLGAAAWFDDELSGWYFDWVADLAAYFGFRGRGEPKAEGAPEECSWAVVGEEANDGPCLNGRAAYGVPATLLRYLLDHRGPEQGSGAEGDAALMRRLVRSSASGFETVRAELGDGSLEGFLVEFGVALWADGRLGDWLLSWDIAEIFDTLAVHNPGVTLEPHTSSAAAPSLDVQVRAASHAYLEWSPPAGHAPTSLRIRTPGGDELPEHMLLWILRVG